ncbi:MAG: hypothetical protein FJW78_03270, partial [Actinobacteria bacterium]|nr:hypothetical protein [Actinomycetota bacterium]
MPVVLALAAIGVATVLGLAAMGAVRVASGGARLAADLAALSAGRALLDAIPAALVDPWDLRGRLRDAARRAAAQSADGSGARVDDLRLVGQARIPMEVEVRVRRPGPLGTSITATARAGVAAVAGMPRDGPVGWATGGG